MRAGVEYHSDCYCHIWFMKMIFHMVIFHITGAELQVRWLHHTEQLGLVMPYGVTDVGQRWFRSWSAWCLTDLIHYLNWCCLINKRTLKNKLSLRFNQNDFSNEKNLLQYIISKMSATFLKPQCPDNTISLPKLILSYLSSEFWVKIQ